jgi:hypothetical protein
MGGSGEGPGGFESLYGAFLIRPDTISALDGAAHRLTKFLRDGRVVSTVSFRASDGYPEVYLGAASDGSHVVAWIRQVPRDPASVTADVMELGRFEADGGSRAKLGTDLGMRRLGSPVPFSGHFLGVMVGDTTFHTDGLRGEVRATGPTGDIASRRMERPWRACPCRTDFS